MSDAYRPASCSRSSRPTPSLPLVRAITTDLVRLSREVIDRRERLALLSAGRKSTAKDPYREELAQIEEELDKDSERLQAYVDELRELGVEPKNGPEGLVDFPCHDGRADRVSVLEARRSPKCCTGTSWTPVSAAANRWSPAARVRWRCRRRRSAWRLA